MPFLNKKILNFLVIIILSLSTFWWASFIFHVDFNWNVVLVIIALRILTSVIVFKDYSLSWSKVTQKTFLMKTIIVTIPMIISIAIFYKEVRIAFILSEASFLCCVY